MIRPEFPKQSTNRSDKVLDLVHADPCGPMREITPSGNQYFLTMIDDYGRYCTIYFLKEKSQAVDKIVELIQQADNYFERPMKILRTDRGGEFTSIKLKDFLKNKGIKQQLTAPYSPQQNGVAERKNLSLMEMTRCRVGWYKSARLIRVRKAIFYGLKGNIRLNALILERSK